MRRWLRWGFQHALAYELRMGSGPGGNDPEGRVVAPGWARSQVTEEDWVEQCEILRPQELCNAERILEFRDSLSAVDFLRRIADDPFGMQALREALAEASPCVSLVRMKEREVLAQLAWRLVAGAVHVAVRLGKRPAGGNSPGLELAPRAEPIRPVRWEPPPPEPPRERAPSAPAVADPLLSDGDVAGCDCVRQASREGAPFILLDASS